MTIKRNHIPYYEEIFGLPGLLKDPTLVFGFQDIRIPEWAFSDAGRTTSWLLGNTLRYARRVANWSRSLGAASLQASPADYRAADLGSLLVKRGLHKIDGLDLYDQRANLHWDMNAPIPQEAADRYNLVIDIGSIEHIFDTRTCLENMLRLVKLEGFYVLHTPVNGYFAHGFHVFNPEMLSQTLELNGFTLCYRKFTAPNGRRKTRSVARGDTLMWIVAKRTSAQEAFVCPQQSFWQPFYAESELSRRTKIQEEYWKSIEEIPLVISKG